MQAKNVRLFSSFALVIGLALLATPVFGQGVAFQASSLPQQARIEGITETMGAVVLQATSAGSITAGSSITVLYSGSITNTVTGVSLSGSFANGTPKSCSNVGTVTAMNGFCPSWTNGSTGGFGVAATGNQLTISVTGTTGAMPNYVYFAQGDYIVVSQVRVNVNALGASVSTVTATMSGTSANPTTNPITFTQSTVPVASVVSPSLSVSFNVAGVTAPTFQSCAVAASAVNVSISERYPAAFTTSTQESSFTPGYAVNNGTTLTISFAGVPAGMGVALVGLDATTSGTITGATTPSSTVQAGNATYVLTLSADSTSAAEKAVFDFTIGALNSAGTAIVGASNPSITALGTTASITASVTLGPVQAASAGPVSFAANTQGTGTVATIGDCVTNLLFPFVTNQVGFDTSVQIANTTSDALAFSSGNATKQNGTCTLTLYPTDLTAQTATAAGTVGTPSQITTPTISAGGVYSFLLSGSSFKSQSGYVLGVCRFVDAHGFSFVTNGPSATATISQGLLALVVPSGSIATARLAGTTESLTH